MANQQLNTTSASNTTGSVLLSGCQHVNELDCMARFEERMGAEKAAKLDKGSKTPGRGTVGKVTREALRDIAEKKMADLNCDTVDSAVAMIEGSARSVGLEVVG